MTYVTFSSAFSSTESSGEDTEVLSILCERFTWCLSFFWFCCGQECQNKEELMFLWFNFLFNFTHIVRDQVSKFSPLPLSLNSVE